jgi:predicted kinase
VTQLYVIRGNSASGKTTVAHALRAALEPPAMVVEQDHLRRIALKEKDQPENTDAVELIRRVAEFGLERGYRVVVEGILTSEKYGPMISGLIAHADGARVFYLNVGFDETLRRHATKSNAHAYGEVEMRGWWRERDLLGVANETLVEEASTLEQTVALMLA